MSTTDPTGEAPELSILIPAWNEEGNIGPLLRRCHATLAEMGIANAEILVIDGGSVDGTVAEAEAEGAIARKQEGRGYGGALRTGFAMARGRYVQTMDSDLSHEPEVIEQLYAARERADVVIASRYVKGGAADIPLYRAVLSRILNVVFTTVLPDSGEGYFERLPALPGRCGAGAGVLRLGFRRAGGDADPHCGEGRECHRGAVSLSPAC